MNTAWRRAGLIFAATLGWGLALGSPDALARRGGPTVTRGPEATRALAIVQQEALPALEARRVAALARSQALDAWFAGTQATPAAALPELTGRALLDPPAIWGELRALDRAAEVRAAERIAPPPADLHPADYEDLSAARTATLDAEDATDTRIRRFWSGLLATAERAPELQNSAIRVRVAALQERAPTPTSIGPEGPSETEAEAAVVRAQAEAGLLTLQAAAVRAATIPGDATLDDLVQRDITLVQSHLQRLDEATTAPDSAVWDAADRLERAAPLTTIDLSEVLEAWKVHTIQQGVDQLLTEQDVLEARITSEVADTPLVSVEVAQHQLETARQGLRQAQADQTALRATLGADQTPTAELTPSDALRLQRAEAVETLAGLRVQLAEQTLDRSTREAESIRSIQDTTEDDVAKAQADAATKEAEAARAAEQRSAEAEIRQMVAEFSKQRATILEARKKREEDARTLLDVQGSTIQNQRTDLAAALSLGPLDQNRQHRLDDVYRSARATVTHIRQDHTTLRNARNELLTRVAAQHETLPEPSDYDLPGADSSLVTDLTHEIEMLHAALDRDLDIADRDLDASMDLLADAKAFRRLALTHASTDARAVIQSQFLDELTLEIGEVPFVVGTDLRRGFTLVRHLPTLVLDLGIVAAFIWGSIELVVLLLLWWMARERTSEWLKKGMMALTAVRPGDLGLTARVNDWVSSRGVSGSWLNLNAVLLPALLYILDLTAGVLIYNELPHAWVYVRLAVFLWLLRAIWQLGNALVPALLVTPEEDRPGAREVSAEGRTRALRTVQLVLTWVVLTSLLSRVALDILDADRLNDLVDGLGSAAGWVIALVTLHKWAPDLRHSVAQDPDDALGRLLVQQSDATLLRAPLAGLAVGVLTIRQASRLLTSLVDRRSGLAWVRTAMARQSLKNTDDAPTQRLHPTVHSRIARFHPADVSTDAEKDLLAKAFADWQREGRRGMVAVTGQRGSGKSRLIRRVPEVVGTEENSLPIHRVRLDRDIFDPAHALAWLVTALSGQADAPPATDSATAVRLLDQLPPTVFVVDDLHRCFLRAVGGYRGLREVLTTMHAVSDRHFWICSFHGDNWAYLEGIGQAVNLGVFRTRVAMQPLSPTTLRDWLEAHTRTVGLEPSYDDLAAEGWIGSEPERARQRARNAYFRLLAEATRGNPRVALETWTSSLRRGETEGTTAVVLFDQPDPAILVQGGEHALFVLAALVVHDGLDVKHLVRVLNLHDATCRATCRRLEGLGVLTSDAHDEHYDITMAWRPAVHRHLRRKHLLHRE